MNTNDRNRRSRDVFDTLIRVKEEHPESELGENVDSILGLEAVSSAATGGTSHSRTEQYFDEVCHVGLQLLKEHFDIPAALDAGTVRSRVVVASLQQPFMEPREDFFFVVFNTGYLKSVQNAFATHFRIAEIGSRVPTSEVPAGSATLTNFIGGGDIQKAFATRFREAAAELLSLFVDIRLVQRYFGLPVDHPQQILDMNRLIGYEVAHGVYSSEHVREQVLSEPSGNSRQMACLAATYAALHETAHAIFRLDPPPLTDKMSLEHLCDMAASITFPHCVNRLSAKWPLRMNAVAQIEEFIGLAAFFFFEELRRVVVLSDELASGEVREDSPEYQAEAENIREVARRGITQLRFVKGMLAKNEELRDIQSALAGEVMALRGGLLKWERRRSTSE